MHRSFTATILALVALVSAGARLHAAEIGKALAPTSGAVFGKREHLLRVAPDLAPKVLELALRASDCALRSGAATKVSKLAVIDYSRPSTDRRLWVFDLKSATLLFSEHVAHGQGSGENMTTRFSNVEGSHQSSLGLFLTGDSYMGGNGYSMNLDGLETGINDRARERRIVMHGAPYVDPVLAAAQGRLGRSHGCPALRPAIAGKLIDSIKDGHLLFAYYPDADWIDRSEFLSCGDVKASARNGVGLKPSGSAGRAKS